MKTLMSVVEKVARVDSNILLIGESGVGKGLIAETIHKLSNRSNNNFVNINCGAIPETLLESELFGYEKGAFTGANREGKIGQIELADKGTLFLDEISELPLQMQVKLLKVINEKKFIRVGGTKTVTSDFRLIAATNKDLRRLVKEGKFREDLFYRLNVVPISIPPLRERKEDIIVLVKYFLEKYNKRYNVSKKISPEAFDVFLEYNWPGNVRELENCIERIVVTVDKDIIDLSDLPGFLFKPFQDYTEPTELLPLKKAVEQTERQLIIKAYKLYKNTYKVANILGISQPTVVRKLKKYKQEVSDN
jgi:transcriptional regulator with PAS, ATPase and Fis domain